MVHQETFEGKPVYVCDECKLAYSEKEIAKKCQEHCARFKACSLEIIKHAVKK